MYVASKPVKRGGANVSDRRRARELLKPKRRAEIVSEPIWSQSQREIESTCCEQHEMTRSIMRPGLFSSHGGLSSLPGPLL